MQTLRTDVQQLRVLSAGQRAALSDWLSQHSDYRLAASVDCGCDKSIADERHDGFFGVPMANYEPYLLTSDFNRDGLPDFAVVVLKKGGKADEGKLLIFNGQPAGGASLAFSTNVSAPDEGLFLTAEDSTILYGFFYSEGCEYEPKGTTYVEDCGDDD
jgi:hypothetical protein